MLTYNCSLSKDYVMLRRWLTELYYYAFTCQHLEEPKSFTTVRLAAKSVGKNLRRDDQGIINIEDLRIASPAHLNFRTGRS
jgi:hypothetical protein